MLKIDAFASFDDLEIAFGTKLAFVSASVAQVLVTNCLTTALYPTHIARVSAAFRARLPSPLTSATLFAYFFVLLSVTANKAGSEFATTQATAFAFSSHFSYFFSRRANRQKWNCFFSPTIYSFRGWKIDGPNFYFFHWSKISISRTFRPSKKKFSLNVDTFFRKRWNIRISTPTGNGQKKREINKKFPNKEKKSAKGPKSSVSHESFGLQALFEKSKLKLGWVDSIPGWEYGKNLKFEYFQFHGV